MNRACSLFTAAVTLLMLSSCLEKSLELSEIGSKPKFTKIDEKESFLSSAQDKKNAYADKGNYNHQYSESGVDEYTLAANGITKRKRNTNNNSLWRAGNKSFFQDQRACKRGDILTVMIDIKDQQAKLQASAQINSPGNLDIITTIFRNLLQSTSFVDAILGPKPEGPPAEGTRPIQAALEKGSADLLKTTGSNISRGGDTFKFNIAAIVKQELPNGNFYIEGRQEMVVDYEMREITLCGVIRPEDITSDNTIAYDKIAEARISYGGRGAMSRQQKPKYGTELFDILSPF